MEGDRMEGFSNMLNAAGDSKSEVSSAAHAEDSEVSGESKETGLGS